MAFLSDLRRFYGTGEKNPAGQSLEEFLEHYNPAKYESLCNTADIVVVRCEEKLTHWGQPLKVLMVKRSNHPSIGFWATPGGFVELKEDISEGAARELEEETCVKGLPLRQMRTWGEWQRDPRWRIITTSYLALVEGDLKVQAADDAKDAQWLSWIYFSGHNRTARFIFRDEDFSKATTWTAGKPADVISHLHHIGSQSL